MGRSVSDVRNPVDAGYWRCFPWSKAPGRLWDNLHHRTFLGNKRGRLARSRLKLEGLLILKVAWRIALDIICCSKQAG